jgi:hypothetical protein
VLPEDIPLLAGSPLVIVAPVGHGQVIYIAADITFRGYWYALNQLFLNTLILGSSGR